MQRDYSRPYVRRDGTVWYPWVGRHPGSKRVGFGHWLRHIRTTAERRANQDWPVRAKRRPKRLPEAWDDIPRGDLGHRSWKRHRRHQWKGR